MKKAARTRYYKAVLDNLLEIKGRDQNIFTRVYGTSSFDFERTFAEANLMKVLKQKEFDIKLVEDESSQLLRDAKKATNVEEFQRAYEKNLKRLYESQIEQLSDGRKFEKVKEDIISKLKGKTKDTRTKWMQFIRKCIDNNIMENIWPLHIATMFVSVGDEKNKVYAPLILREVNLEYTKNELEISSLSGWKYNEKLIHYLELLDLTFKMPNIETMDGLEAITTVAEANTWNVPKNIAYGEYQNLTKDEVGDKLTFHPGTVLGMYSPEGGSLRTMMKKIIDKNEVSKVIVGMSQAKYAKREAAIEKKIKEESDTLYRVQQANFSQDKATISSLLGDTIIWGPPGTGKSQTIANIVANVLESGQSGVVMSQKKAALDVLKSRMGPLAKYVLYILNDNKMDKSHFYKEMSDFIKNIDEYTPVDKEKGSPLISADEIKAVEYLDNAKDKGVYQGAIEYMQYMDKYNIRENLGEILTLLVSFTGEYNLPKETYDGLQPNIDALAKINDINIKGIGSNKRIKSLKSKAAKLALLNDLGIYQDVQKMLDTLQTTNVETIQMLFTVNHLFEKNQDESSQTISYIENIIAKQFNERVELIHADPELEEKYGLMVKAIKRGHRLPYKFIDDHKVILKLLFKVVITTPQSSFIDWSKNAYDYVILDESSQMFVESGLPILYLGKIKVIAGDPQQMKPSNWFSARTEYDDDIAENAPSLLDYAIDKDVYSVMLNKNYRSSSAALMTFSSKQFYESKLDVADNNNGINEASIEVVNVGGEWKQSTNLVEVETVIRIAEDNLKRYESIIIMTFNQKQRDEIYKYIFKKHPKLLKAINNEQLSLRNVENIQGDEADLVIASVVYDETTSMGMTYVARPGGMNALNVAVSRAKDKMIVVKSVYWDELKVAKTPDFDMFVNWMKFLDLNIDDKKTYSQLEKKASEKMNRTVSNIADELLENISTRVVTQVVTNYQVGTQTIDIAFIGKDDNKYYGGVILPDLQDSEKKPYEAYLDNVDKQSYLESKGYPIYSIFEVNWWVNRKQLFNDLEIFLSDNADDQSE